MRTLLGGGAAQIASSTQTMCHAIKLTRSDGLIMAFTDHDVDLTIGSTTYSKAQGFLLTDLKTSGNSAPTNQDIIGLIDDATITTTDLMGGIYDNAEVEIFKVDYSVPEIICTLQYGLVGEIRFAGSRYTAELRGLGQLLAKTIGESYGPTCRATLGDARCGKALGPYSHNGTLTAITSRRYINASALSGPVDGYFNGGTIKFNTGPNIGITAEVKQWVNATRQFELFLPLPYMPLVGDTFTAVRGCDKLVETCRDVYSNVVRFRGEPYIPGMEKVVLPVRRSGAV